MNAEPLVQRILDDEGLIGDLEGSAAEALVAWLVRGAEQIAHRSTDAAAARKAVEDLCRRGREMAAAAAAAADPAAELQRLIEQPNSHRH